MPTSQHHNDYDKLRQFPETSTEPERRQILVRD